MTIEWRIKIITNIYVRVYFEFKILLVFYYFTIFYLSMVLNLV